MRAREYHILSESPKSDFRAMFGPLEMDAKTDGQVKREYNWAYDTFSTEGKPNSERILWYMRFIRLWAIGNIFANTEYEAHSDAEVQTMIDGETVSNEEPKELTQYKKAVKKTAKKADTTEAKIQSAVTYVMSADFKRAIGHFLVVGIHDINKMVFGWKMPDDLIDEMQNIEHDWKENQSRMINPDEYNDLEVIIDFGDGYAWYNLNVDGCSIEGSAMGHCGNAGWGNSDDTVFSLRKTIEQDGKMYHIPYLTFILKANGHLSEMKGRGNDKPTKKYHPYIKALLMDDIIEGIDGGGYLPENNFSMDDLPSEEAEEMKEKKPELRGFWDEYVKQGITTFTIDKLDEKMNDMNMGSADYSVDDKYIGLSYEEVKKTSVPVTVYEWSDFETFLTSIDDSVVLELLNYYKGESAYGEVDIDIPDSFDMETFYKKVLAEIRPYYRERIFKHLEIEDDGSARSLQSAVWKMMRDRPRYVEYMDQALEDNVDLDDSSKQKIKERIQEYINDNTWDFAASQAFVQIDGTDFDKPVRLFVDFNDLVLYTESSAEGEDDYSYDLYNMRNEYGGSDWSNMEMERMEERRNEDEWIVDRPKKEGKHYYGMDAYQDAKLNELIDPTVNLDATLDRIETMFSLHESQDVVELAKKILR